MHTIEVSDEEFVAIKFALAARPVVSNDELSIEDDTKQIELTLQLLQRLEDQ